MEAYSQVESGIQMFAVPLAKEIFPELDKRNLMLDPMLSQVVNHPLYAKLECVDTEYVRGCVLQYSFDVLFSQVAYVD